MCVCVCVCVFGSSAFHFVFFVVVAAAAAVVVSSTFQIGNKTGTQREGLHSLTKNGAFNPWSNERPEQKAGEARGSGGGFELASTGHTNNTQDTSSFGRCVVEVESVCGRKWLEKDM